MRTHPYRLLPLALVAVAAVVGCQDNRQHGEAFDDTDHPTPIGLVAQAQAAAGAKADATLYDRHFRGDRLDPLGEAKLDLMLKATATGDAVPVYLDMPEAQANARRASVNAYLAKAGVPADKIELAVGPNLGNTTPTAYNLGTLYNADGSAKDIGVTGGLGANGPGGTVGK